MGWITRCFARTSDRETGGGFTPCLCVLREIITAVDMNEWADDVAGIVCGEARDDVRDVLRLGDPARWQPLRQLCKPLFGSAQTRHRGVRDTGRDGVDADAVRRSFPRHPALQTHNSASRL